MLHGWHGHNGVSLGNNRLGFVCTGQTVDGSAGLEGYYFDYGREIAESERVRFAYDEQTPDYDPALAPQLDHADWPEERLKKVERAYAMEYVRSLVPTMLELFGPDETAHHLGHAARLIGMQFYDETAVLLGIEAGDAEAFAYYLAALAAAQGEKIEMSRSGSDFLLCQSGWRLMDGIQNDHVAFVAWNRLWEGALAVHNRRLALVTRCGDFGIEWRISG
jgi:hypothetical protein